MKSDDQNEAVVHDPHTVEAPLEVFQRRLQLRGPLIALLALLTSVLLTISFTGWWVHLPHMAYFALVPWALTLTGALNRRWGLLWAWMCGVIFWAINLYWLWWIDLSGYVSGVLYLSLYWFVAAVILRATSRRSWPMWICFPVVWVALEFLRGQMPVQGFPWLFMAHTQYCRPWLIQISDTLGQYGVSFLVVMGNGVIIDLLTLPLFGREEKGKVRILRRGPCGAVVFAMLLAMTLTYGWYRTVKESGYLSEGPSFAVVQSAFPVSLSTQTASPEKIFEEHLIASRKFIGAGCDLLVWAESMAPAGLNSEYMEFLRKVIKFGVTEDQRNLAKIEYEKRQKYHDRITELLSKVKSPLLTGSQSYHYEKDEDGTIVRNSALWFDQSGRITGQYSKRKLVPFSEYVPFKDGWPWLHGILRAAVPSSMPQLQPGREWTRFKITRGSKEWTLASPICFEGTFPSVCRNMVIKDGKKVTDILINISNDGWFVWKYGDRPYRASSEHAQHLVQYYFRAVENRVPVVRCVNTGISASIDSNGREAARVEIYGETMVPAAILLGARESENSVPTGVRGYQIGPGILVDNRITLYSIVGDLFAWILVAVAVVLSGVGLWRPKVKTKG